MQTGRNSALVMDHMAMCHTCLESAQEYTPRRLKNVPFRFVNQKLWAFKVESVSVAPGHSTDRSLGFVRDS